MSVFLKRLYESYQVLSENPGNQDYDEILNALKQLGYKDSHHSTNKPIDYSSSAADITDIMRQMTGNADFVLPQGVDNGWPDAGFNNAAQLASFAVDNILPAAQEQANKKDPGPTIPGAPEGGEHGQSKGRGLWNKISKTGGMLNNALNSIDRAHSKMKSGDTFGAVGDMARDVKHAWSKYGNWHGKVGEQWDNLDPVRQAAYKPTKNIQDLDEWKEVKDQNLTNPDKAVQKLLKQRMKQYIDLKQPIPSGVVDYLSGFDLFSAKQWNRSITAGADYGGGGGPESERWMARIRSLWDRMGEEDQGRFNDNIDEFIDYKTNEWKNRSE